MEIISDIVSIVLHIDDHLAVVMQTYGMLVYALLFIIVFVETGLVVTPFLPGDSLLFAAGALSATGGINIVFLFVLLSFAAIAGDTVNYWIGYYIGPKVFKEKKSRFFNKEHLDRTHAFYEKYGAKVIILARFIPIMRTFAPFVAGVGKMTYGKFISYNIIGGLAWVGIFTFVGYYFGNLPIVKENFSLIILGIILVSVLPIAFELLKKKTTKKLASDE